MRYCSYCGKRQKESTDICIKCGKILPKESKISNNRKSLTSLVLGIIAIFWSLIMFVSLSQGIETLKVEYYYNPTMLYFIPYYIGYTLFALIPAIIGLCLGISAKKKNTSKMNKIGIIFSSISLGACLCVLIGFMIVIFR